MTPIAVSTASESSWLLSNSWWLVLIVIWIGLALAINGLYSHLIALTITMFTLSAAPSVDLSTPEAASLGFSIAISKLDLQLAKRYCTPRAKEMLANLQGISSSIPAESKQKILEEAKGLNNARCNIISNRATCIVCCRLNAQESDSPINLIRNDTTQLWQVDFTKDQSLVNDFPPPPQ